MRTHSNTARALARTHLYCLGVQGKGLGLSGRDAGNETMVRPTQPHCARLVQSLRGAQVGDLSSITRAGIEHSSKPTRSVSALVAVHRRTRTHARTRTVACGPQPWSAGLNVFGNSALCVAVALQCMQA